MKKPGNTRRDFLKTGGAALGSSWLALNMPMIVATARAAADDLQAGAVYKNLTPEEAVELGAWVDQIIPPDETPGAREIGVVYFIDGALGGFMKDAAPMLKQGLAEFQQSVQASYPPHSRLSELSFEQQTEALQSAEDTPLFGMLHFMTLCGMFSMPGYGGNRNKAGWNLIGFEDRHAWQPPFGYYDAAVHGEAVGAGGDHEHG